MLREAAERFKVNGVREMEQRKKLKLDIPDFVCDTIERIRAYGESAYVVGGSLRDLLLSKEPHDFDVASSATPDKICEIFSDTRVIKTGIAHGTVTLLTKGGPIEVTTFRIDGAYGDMRHPESVEFTSKITDDLARRDFTVNAMAYAEGEGLIDVFGGESDVKNAIIRTVGLPKERFSEDALRIMRAFRFSAQLGFSIEAETLNAARELRLGLLKIARERIFSELIKLLLSPYPMEALELMNETGVLSTVLPQYKLTERALRLLPLVPTNDVSRLSAFFCDTEEGVIIESLASLKASNRQKRVALIVSAAREKYSDAYSVASLKGRLSEDAGDALLLSVLLENSPKESLELLKTAGPCRISELELDGELLKENGFSGREIGRTLSYLLERVMREPSLNERSRLIELALEFKADCGGAK